MRPKSVCLYPGCFAETASKYCTIHDNLSLSIKEDRPDATERGYDSIWRRLRAQFILIYPLCNHCERQGRVTVAADVDHILRFNGITDPRRLDWDNLQSLCRECHSIKSSLERNNK